MVEVGDALASRQRPVREPRIGQTVEPADSSDLLERETGRLPAAGTAE